MPTMSTSRVEQGSGWMDDVLMIAGIAVMRAFLGQVTTLHARGMRNLQLAQLRGGAFVCCMELVCAVY